MKKAKKKKPFALELQDAATPATCQCETCRATRAKKQKREAKATT